MVDTQIFLRRIQMRYFFLKNWAQQKLIFFLKLNTSSKMWQSLTLLGNTLKNVNLTTNAFIWIVEAYIWIVEFRVKY